MPVGDAATAASFPLVDPDDTVSLGYEEINRTRDLLAQVKNTIPVNLAGYRSTLKINYGPGIPGPDDGIEGEIWFKV